MADAIYPASINWHVWKDEATWRDWMDALNLEADRRGVKRWPRREEGAAHFNWREDFFEKGLSPGEALDQLDKKA